MSNRASPPVPKDAIAIVGIGCRFPGGGHDAGSFWKLLADGVDAISDVPADRWDTGTFYHPDGQGGRTNSRWGGFVPGVEAFDSGFFGMSPREATRTDPQHRMLLEVSWEALEDAGLIPHTLAGSPTAVFVGISSFDYALVLVDFRDRTRIDVYSNTGNALSLAANRISYQFDFKGPSAVVDTACSSSLVAVHMACRSIWDGHSEMALAGGVNVLLNPDGFIGFTKLSMLSPDGRCKAFDASANGFVRAEGVGLVVLKPLAAAVRDGDRVYATIRSTAINSDGRTPGLTVPDQKSQEELIRLTLREAGATSRQVRYVEAHGTGTPVGDPIETRALGTVLGAGRPANDPCLIGSVKTNIGHLEPASGIAGLIKAALVLHHGQVPPNLHFNNPNPDIPFDTLRLRVPRTLEPLPPGVGPAMAGVNSFGFGGTNAHVLLQESDRPSVRPTASTGPVFVPLSARTPEALRALAKAWKDALAVGEWPLSDVAYTACVRRTHHEFRLPVVAKSTTELADHLGRFAAGTDPVTAVGSAPKLAFVFCGQGPQWWGMGRQLLADEPVFRDTVRRCADILDGMADWSLWDELSKATEATSRMSETVVAQPALFVLQVALAELWRSWGVTPSVVVGHSVGEVAAAHVAGALTLEEAVRVIYHRARCVEQAPSRGKMLAVGLSAAEAAEYVGHRTDRIAVAAINGPRSITLSGQGEALEEVAEALRKKDVFHRFLQVQYAFHSPQLDPVQGELTRSLHGIRPKPTTVPLYSTVTGRRIDGATLDPDYWWRNLRNTVYFADAIDRISGEGFDTFLEFGPHPVLSGSVQECLKHRSRTGKVIPTLRRGSDDRPALLRSVGELYVLNQPFDWPALAPAGRPVPLPGYRFQREKFWFETAEARRTRAGGACHPLLGQPVPAAYPSWEQTVGTATHPFLNDHQAQGHPLFPATGYVEMAFAVAAAVSPDRPQSLHDIKLLKACFLPEGTVKLQTVYTPDGSTFGVHTGGGGLPLTTHVTGVLRPSEEARGAALALDAVRQRCTVQYAPADYYGRLSGFGLDYGPAFQGVQELWTGPNEALGRVSLPDGTGTQLTDFHVHPVVLDAGLQVIFGTLSLPAVGERRGAYLPVAIEKVTLFAKPTGPVWCHAKLTDRDRRTVTADLRVYDESGAPVCEVRGVRCQAVGADGDDGASLDDILYEYRWQAAPRDDRPTPITAPAAYWTDLAALAESLQTEARTLNAECELRVRTERFTADLNPLAVAFIARALGESGGTLRTGERFTTDALADRVGVATQHRRFFGRLLAILAEDGYLTQTASAVAGVCDPGPTASAVAGVCDPGPTGLTEAGYSRPTTWEVRAVPPATAPLDLWRRMLDRHPAYQAELNLFQRCGSELAKVLRGQQDPMDLIFPGGSTSTAEHLYQDSPYQRYTNAVTRRAISRLQQTLPAGRVLRVLEVGGGTGGLTAHLLSALDPAATRYVFTDLSGHFFDAAQQKFGSYPFVEYRRLDLERDPVAQGFDAGSFDVVVVSQALHATADLRQTLGHLNQLLAAGGLLLATESITRSRFLDLVFGTLNGWWRATDRDLRPDHPLLTFPQWKGVLEATGFGAVADAAATGEPMDCVVLMARADGVEVSAPTVVETPTTTDRWLVLADTGGVATQLSAALTRAAGSCVRVTVGTEFARLSADEFRVNPTRPDDMKRLMAEATVGQALRGVVHLWNLDAPPTDGLDGASLDAAQTAGCLSIVHLLHVWGPDAKPGTRWWVVTRGAHRVGGEPGPVAVAQAPAWGLVRAIGREYSHLKCGLIDLDTAPATAAAECILAELASPTADDELAFRGATRFAHRYVRAPLDDRPINATGRAYRLEVARSNTLDGLRLRTTTPRPPGPGEVGIEVVAAGLNFSDVLKALGLYPGLPVGPVPLGIECSGRITAVGEGVTGFAPGDAVAAVTTHTFSSHLNAPAVAVGHMPMGVSFEEAATIPIAFLTAHYALNHMGRMEPGERVLIHSATGGVGLAAIQIARAGGAEVFATAGSKEKRELLRALGVPHVFDSRSLAFIDEVNERTGGRGVDLVLNSLSGEALTRGMGLMGDHGRFLEIGKRDIYADTRMPLRTFRKNLSFMAIDLDRALRERPERIGGLYRELLKEFDRGVLHPLPHRTFAAGDAASAFRTMAQAKHVGKVVLNLTDTGGQVRAAVGETAELRPDRTYLVVGGAGGFGMAVTDWLVASGAKHVMLVGRRTTLPPDTTATINRLRQTGARVEAVSADVTDAAQVAGLLARTGGEWPTLAGVIHTAMVLDDCLLMNLTADRLTKVLRPKMLGAWHLHTQTADRPLDFFVMFSSMSSVFGLAGQANYAAANAFLDALAHHRRALGLPATTVNWGSLGGVGYVAEHKDVAAKFDTMGIRHFTPQEAVSLLGRFIRQGVTQIGVMRVDWRKLARSLYGEAVPPRFTGLLDAMPGSTATANQSADVGVRASVLQAPPEKRKETLQKLVRERLAKVLGTVEEKISTEIPLVSLGVDSLMAVELHNWIEGELRVSLPIVELVRGPSVSKLADVLLAQLTAGESADASPTPTPTPTVEVAPPVELPPPDTGEPFPCTDLQIAYLGARWIDSELGKRGCHISVEIAVDRPLDVARLSAAWQQMLNRHPTTRLVFTKKMTQRVLPAAEYALPTDDWSDDPQAEAKLAALRQRLADQVFDPTAWPLFEVRVVRLGERSFRLFASLDMLVVDMQSLHLLLGDWLALYDGTAGPVADVDAFRRYAIQTTEVRGTPAHTRDSDYWAARVADFPPPPPLPLRADPATLRRPRFGTAGVRLTADQWAQLRTRARENDLTPAGLLAAAFARVLANWSGAERFCLNLPVNDRTAAQQPLIGPYTSTLLLDVNTAGDFWTAARTLHGTLLDGMEHNRCTGIEFTRMIARHRKSGLRPITPVVFTSMLYPSPLAGWGRVVDAYSQTPQVWLDCQVVDDDGALWVRWDYVEQLFDADELKARLNEYGALLERLAATGSAEVATDPDLVDLFRAQVKLDPARPAVVTDSGTVSYAELDAESDRVASGLIAAGVKPGHLVAVCCPTSPALVSGLLGIHKAGAAYLPLDPDLPPARIAELLSDSRAEHIVSDPTLADRWPAGRVPLALTQLAATPAGPLPTRRGADAVAYVIYTSGSTGRPKGVVMTHAAVVNTVEEVNRRFEVGPADRVFAFSRLTFDLSVYDIFGTLAAGAAVVLPADTSRREPRHWLAAVRRHAVTVWNSVPSAMEMLVAVAERTPGDDRLRCVLLSGDWVPLPLPDRIRKQFTSARVVSLGGATECAIWSCFHPVNGLKAEWKSIPYGRALAGQTLHVLCDALRPVPAGEPGHLFIGGRGLATGYLHDAERTTAAFVSLPGTNGHAERVYRTGDRARVLPNGEVEFLGRGDGQVKVRGYRVELAEVEAALARHPAVKQCAVVALGDTGGPRELAAYYSLSAPVADAALRTHLTDTLPEYMVPQHWTELPTLPLNGNGKIDRKGLHHPRAVTPPAAPTPSAVPNGILLDPRERATFRAAGHGIRRDLNGSPRVPLVTPEPDALSAWIEQRHSQREFGTRPIAAHQFAKLLHALRVRGEAGKRNYASAGGTYSVQLYLHLKAGAVEGQDAGTYYYQPEDHHLARLSDRADLCGAVHFPTNRPLARQAAFTLFLVSRLSAVTPLYGDIARPLATLEAGAVSHLLETLAPACEVGLCQVSAVNIDSVRDAFALDADHVLLHTLVGGSLPTAEDTVAHHQLHAAPPTPVVVGAPLPLAAGEIQAELVRMWKQTLEVDAVDVHASFFELGGDSLRAMNLMVQLQDRFGVEVNVADLYTHSTLADLAAFIATAPKADGGAATDTVAGVYDPGPTGLTEAGYSKPALAAPSLNGSHAPAPAVRTEDVAIIGLVGRLPGGPDLDAFWDTLRNGRSTVRPVPPERAALVPGFANASPDTFRASYIDGIDQFDPQFFRLSPREAKRIDPGQRLLLMTCHELLESTGYGGKALAGKRTGVFVAGGGGEYWQLAREVPGLDDLRKFILGSMPSVLANRVSHALNLSGPSLTVDTSCSSSLVAVDLACQSLRASDCETAVVAAANLILSPGVFTAFRQDGMEAKGGQCRTFDAGGDGFVRGEGVAAVLLKPLHKALADGDTVHAVIKGTAVNHDGRMNALEIPNPLSQAEVIALAHRRAGTSPDTIDYVEAHGTGTALGDPIEFGGLKKAFAGVRSAACGVGSVKSNLGHLEYAAGLAGLVKVILALRHSELPPSLHFRAPNPHLDFSDSPFYLVDRPRAWVRSDRPRRAAVSSFGMGGTNAHVILEEPPSARPAIPRTGLELFVLSARSEAALGELAERYRRTLGAPGNTTLADVCGTVALGRTHFAHRLAIVADSLPTVVKALADFRAGVKTIPATMWSGVVGESVATADRPATAVAGAEAYVRGAEPQWPHLFVGRRVALPTYPYQTSSCWLDVPPPTAAAHTSPLAGEVGGTAGSTGWGVSQSTVTPAAVLPSVADVEALLIGELAKVLELPAEHILPEVPFFELGVDSITAVELIRRLEAHTGKSLSPTLFFDAPTVRKLADVLLREHGDALAVSSPEPQAVVTPAVTTSIGDGSHPIAVIGMAGRFPGATDLNSFWRNLRDGVDSVTEVPADRWEVDRHYTTDRTQVGKTYTRWGGFLTDLDQFDALFFRSSPREARWFDPQQRLLLETAWEALEDAGHAGKSRPKDRYGVFVGATHYHFRDMMIRQADAVPDAGVALGNSSAILANRLSYFLDLRGPSLTIDTLCSSSLVAVHLAVTSLRRGECDTAIVAGVHAGMSPMYYQAISRLQAASAVGRCQSFGTGADGYVPAEGVGVIVLRRQADAEAAGDQIHGVIRGSAANHGGQSAGLTVPSASGQAAVVRAALIDAGVKAEELDYVEAHGTGTSLGDPIEVRGLQQVFPAGARQVCGIGSLKSNIGHLEPAAGIGSLIKVLLALRAGEFPPSLHLSEVNPLISFEETPFFFVDRRRAWVRNGVPRRAGVSSFGLGGSNAHVVIEDTPPVPRPHEPTGTPRLLVLSARSPAGLDRLADAFARHVESNPGVELRDVCFTAAVGRAHFAHRLAVLATTPEELTRRLREPADERSVWRGHATGTPPAPPNASGLPAVARAYVAGADVSADIAPGGRRISLPTFPFDRVTCRVQAADAPPAVQSPLTPPARKPHPLLGSAAVQPDGAVVFEHTFGIRPRPEGTQ